MTYSKVGETFGSRFDHGQGLEQTTVGVNCSSGVGEPTRLMDIMSQHLRKFIQFGSTSWVLEMLTRVLGDGAE